MSDLTGDGHDGLDLTPRNLTPRSGGRNWLSIGLMVLIAAAIVWVLLRALTDSTLLIYTADKAVEERLELADTRFRLQGSPVGNTIDVTEEGEAGVGFTINFEGELVDVVHIGAPAELFQSGVPVVLEGSWERGSLGLQSGANDGWYYVSDDMVVKHDNDYRLENEDRLREAQEGGELLPSADS